MSFEIQMFEFLFVFHLFGLVNPGCGNRGFVNKVTIGNKMLKYNITLSVLKNTALILWIR